MSCFLIMPLFALNSVAEIYKWVDESGNIHFGDRYDGETAATEVELEVSDIPRRRCKGRTTLT